MKKILITLFLFCGISVANGWLSMSSFMAAFWERGENRAVLAHVTLPMSSFFPSVFLRLSLSPAGNQLAVLLSSHNNAFLLLLLSIHDPENATVHYHHLGFPILLGYSQHLVYGAQRGLLLLAEFTFREGISKADMNMLMNKKQILRNIAIEAVAVIAFIC